MKSTVFNLGKLSLLYSISTECSQYRLVLNNCDPLCENQPYAPLA